MSYPIHSLSAPKANCVKRTGAVKYIVVHYTGNGYPTTKNAAKNNCIYFNRDEGQNASAHYFIDNDSIWMFANPTVYCCWHVGDGKGKYGITNQNSIGIEVVQDGNLPFSSKEIEKLTWLVQKLMKDFNVPASNVVRHYDASRKSCPYYYTPYGYGGDSAWAKLHKTITNGANSNDSSSSSEKFGGLYRCTVNGLRVRRAPSLGGTIVAHYDKGETVRLDDKYYIKEGYVWGTYVGGSGSRNYIAVGRATGKVESDDYLIKIAE